MKLSGVQYGILLSGLATAVLHLLDPILTVDLIIGIGYFISLGAYFLPVPFLRQEHIMVRRGFVVTTLLSLILGVILVVQNASGATAYYAITAEVLLLIFLRLDKPEDSFADPGVPALHHLLGFFAGSSFGFLFIFFGSLFICWTLAALLALGDGG